MRTRVGRGGPADAGPGAMERWFGIGMSAWLHSGLRYLFLVPEGPSTPARPYLPLRLCRGGGRRHRLLLQHHLTAAQLLLQPEPLGCAQARQRQGGPAGVLRDARRVGFAALGGNGRPFGRPSTVMTLPLPGHKQNSYTSSQNSLRLAPPSHTARWLSCSPSAGSVGTFWRR